MSKDSASKKIRAFMLTLLIISLAVILPACAGGGQNNSDPNALSGTVKIDGSSTVFPITEAVSEEFQIENPKARVTVGVSGTGGGFKKFVTGETDVTNASRPIKPVEIAEAKKNGIEYIELRVAYDGLSVVVNKDNDFVDDLSTRELRKMWDAGSRVKTWRDVNPDWPDKMIKFFSPGTDSGTFDYFTEMINGEEDRIRDDMTLSEDDNTLVQGIAGEKNGIGYFGYAYFVENKDKLKVVEVDGIKPTIGSIKSGEYKPLSRPMYIYVNKGSLKKPVVKAFVEFYLETAEVLSEEVGYVPLNNSEYKEELDLINN